MRGYLVQFLPLSFTFTFIQRTIPEKEVVATDIKAKLIFPWQVERILSIKFPEETSRAEQAGYVSSVYLRICSITIVDVVT